MITLKTLPYATKQEVFDQVARHLINQGVQSKAKFKMGEGCAYRGRNKTKCAAGCLIADEEYRKNMEEKGWATLNKVGKVPEEHISFIQNLQQIHDTITPDDWEGALIEIANYHDLSTECLKS